MISYLQIVAGKKQKGNKKTPKDTKDGKTAIHSKISGGGKTADDATNANKAKTADDANDGKDVESPNNGQTGKDLELHHDREDEWHMQRAEKMDILHQFLAKEKLSLTI